MATGMIQRRDIALGDFGRLPDKGRSVVFEIRADRAARTPFRIRRFVLLGRDGTGRIVRVQASLHHVELTGRRSVRLGEGPSLAQGGAPEPWVACAPSPLFLPGDRIGLELSGGTVDPAQCVLSLDMLD